MCCQKAGLREPHQLTVRSGCPDRQAGGVEWLWGTATGPQAEWLVAFDKGTTVEGKRVFFMN